MQENVVLAAFGAAVFLTGSAVGLFFLKFKQHDRATYRPLRLAVGNLLILLFLCSLVALAGEIYYRFFYDTTDSFGLTKTTQRWSERHFHFNNASFRDSVPYPVPIPYGRRRVTFLGDSFTAGHGVADVEDRFVNRIRKLHPDWDVQMLAQCGWDTGQEFGFVESTRQFNYELDLVVLVYCLNDIADIVPEWGKTLERIYRSSKPGYLVRNSYLFNTVYYRWRASQDPDIADYYQFVTENYEGPIWDEQRQRLTQLRDVVRSRNGQLIVVTFPFVHALNGEYQYQFIHDRLDKFWDSLNVPHLDLLAEFKSHDAETLVVNPRDAHPNEFAHAVAASAKVTFIERHLTNVDTSSVRHGE